MRLRLVGKISLSFAVVTVALGLVTMAVGIRAIEQSVRHDAQTRVSYDLRIARLILEGELSRTRRAVESAASQVAHAPETPDQLALALEKSRQSLGLDYLLVTDERGVVIARAHGSLARGDDLSVEPPVASALKDAKAVQSIEILPRQRLKAEGGDLARRAHMAFRPTPLARPSGKREQTSGMVLQAVVPVATRTGSPSHLFLGGVLLNRNYAAVDRVKKLVFSDQLYRGREIGTVTIFQWDVRISTNVTLADGNRAIETRVSRQVYDRVLEAGLDWHDRAFVVRDWYVTAYEPITDFHNKRIGMLYVGTLEAPYTDLRKGLVLRFGLVTAAGVTLVILISTLLARALGKPLHDLSQGSERIAAGDLAWRLPVAKADDEIRDLGAAFNHMAACLEENHHAIARANIALSEKNGALETLNRNYMEMLGFVSHELKSPLSSAVLSAQALKQGIGGELEGDQRRMVSIVCRSLDYATRMIQNYLDLSRIEKGDLTLTVAPISLRGDVIDPTVQDLIHTAEARNMQIEVEAPATVTLEADAYLLRIVFQNLLNNAIKYGREGGRIRVGGREAGNQVVLNVWNEGVGVPADQRAALFTKFHRVRDPRLKEEKGTGLGLFITRDILRRHHGDIRVECDEGQWINFIFHLPLKHAAEAEQRTDP